MLFNIFDAGVFAYEKAVECSDAFSVFLGDLLDSRYRKDYIAAVGEENALLYENYEAMTDEQKAYLSGWEA